MDYAKIKLSAHGDVAIITLSDPSTMNAAGLDAVEELSHAFTAASEGPEARRAIILTGEGRGFCSGANLTSIGGSSPGTPPRTAGDSLVSHYNPLIRLIANLPIPLVTAVNGAAAGIGCSMALLGDMIVAGESAYFLQAFRRIGLIPDGGST